MRRIPLGRRLFAIIDKTDYKLVSQYNWFAIKVKNRWYAIRNVSRGKMQYMHQFLIGTEKGEMVDHEDLDGLNNRRSNLRKCTFAQNNANRKARIDAPFGLKGVRQRGKRFQAYITFNKKQFHFGMHSTAEEAALAYDFAARMCFSEFARTNFEM